MLDPVYLREKRAELEEGLKRRGAKVDLAKLYGLDEMRRKHLQELEALSALKNKANDEISILLREKKDAKSKIDSMKSISKKIDDFDKKVGEIDGNLSNLLLNIPNIPHKSVPEGSDSSKNKVVRSWEEPKKHVFKPKTHIELGERLGILDFKVAAKVTGGGFALYLGKGALLERALINLMLDLHTKKHGYTEVSPPFLVNRASMTGTGQLPKFEEDMYRLKDDDLFLVPTAEVPVTNLRRDEILKEEELPVYYTAYTPCFRREAGSYGKDTKGLVRVHQFDKVELVKFTRPEDSYDELELLVKDAEEVLQLLKIPYRVVSLCAGDLGFAAAKCYDIEAWAPGLNRWLEVSSCSNFESFQARRVNIKYRPRDSKKAEFVHTLNGSGVALARTVIALLENHQQENGTVLIPEALRPYMGDEYLLK